MNHTWTITGLKAFPTLGGKSNVVSTVYFDVDAEENGSRVTHTRIVNLPTQNIQTFIPYESLKPEVILAWVKFHLGSEGIDGIESDVANQLRLQINYEASQLLLQSNSPQAAVPVDLPW